MNKLLLPILAGTFLPFANLHAAPGKTFGGFVPKYSFTLVVTDVESVRTKGVSVNDNAKIPKGIPKYDIGENVKFKIGAKGGLNVADYTMRLRDEAGNRNFYADNADSNETLPNSAIVRKGSKGKANKVTLTLYKYSLSGITPVINKVTYVLEK